MSCRVFRFLRLNATDNTRDSFISTSGYPYRDSPFPNTNPHDNINIRANPRRHRRQHSPIVFTDSMASTESQREHVFNIGLSTSGDSTLFSASTVNPSTSLTLTLNSSSGSGSNTQNPKRNEKGKDISIPISTLGSRGSGSRSGDIDMVGNGGGSDISLGLNPTRSEGHTAIEMSNL